MMPACVCLSVEADVRIEYVFTVPQWGNFSVPVISRILLYTAYEHKCSNRGVYFMMLVYLTQTNFLRAVSGSEHQNRNNNFTTSDLTSVFRPFGGARKHP